MRCVTQWPKIEIAIPNADFAILVRRTLRIMRQTFGVKVLTLLKFIPG